jgi:hypothetical protein
VGLHEPVADTLREGVPVAAVFGRLSLLEGTAHTDSLPLSLSLTHTHTHTHTNTHTLSHSLSLSRIHTLSLTHGHTRARRGRLSLLEGTPLESEGHVSERRLGVSRAGLGLSAKGEGSGTSGFHFFFGGGRKRVLVHLPVT